MFLVLHVLIWIALAAAAFILISIVWFGVFVRIQTASKPKELAPVIPIDSYRSGKAPGSASRAR